MRIAREGSRLDALHLTSVLPSPGLGWGGVRCRGICGIFPHQCLGVLGFLGRRRQRSFWWRRRFLLVLCTRLRCLASVLCTRLCRLHVSSARLAGVSGGGLFCRELSLV